MRYDEHGARRGSHESVCDVVTVLARDDLAYTGARTDRNDVCSQAPSDIEDSSQWFALDHHCVGRARRNASSPERTFEPLRRAL